MLAGCEKKQHYTIEWNTEAEDTTWRADSMHLSIQGTMINKAVAENDRVYMEGDIQEPTLATLTIFLSYSVAQMTLTSDIILESGNILIKNTHLGVLASGTPSNDAFTQVFNTIDSLENAGKASDEIIPNFIREHKSDLCGARMLQSPKIKMPALKELYEGMDESIKALPELDGVRKRIAEEEATIEGNMFQDFEATYEGKTTKLSDYVGKGQYVLVDFWASWCGPCRSEIPNLKKIYEQYKSDKFTVLGVATWDEPAKSLKAIEEDGVTYPQMLNAQKAGSDAYAISSIPEIILFGPDGTILKRGLRGEEIEKTLKEFLVND